MEAPHASEDVIVARGLYKVFGSRPRQAIAAIEQGQSKDVIHRQTGQTVAVQDASFEVRRGEIFVVMGLSGCGKSTLLRLVNRLIEPSAGRLWVLGKEVVNLSRRELVELRRRHLSMVFQSFALLPHLGVLDNAAFGLEVAGVSRVERHKRAQAALERVGLQGVLHSRPRDLSGGMQQRVGLARALACDPTILLMDEAYSALDPLIRHEMQGDLLQLQRERKLTVMFISHDIDEATRLGDRIAIMNAGRIVQIDTPNALIERPADDYVASFFRKRSQGSEPRSPEAAS